MLSQPVSTIFFPVVHCPLGLGELQACPFPDVVLPPLPLSAFSSSPFHCALQDGLLNITEVRPVVASLRGLHLLRRAEHAHLVPNVRGVRRAAHELGYLRLFVTSSPTNPQLRNSGSKFKTKSTGNV